MLRACSRASPGLKGLSRCLLLTCSMNVTPHNCNQQYKLVWKTRCLGPGSCELRQAQMSLASKTATGTAHTADMGM